MVEEAKNIAEPNHVDDQKPPSGRQSTEGAYSSTYGSSDESKVMAVGVD